MNEEVKSERSPGGIEVETVINELRNEIKEGTRENSVCCSPRHFIIENTPDIPLESLLDSSQPLFAIEGAPTAREKYQYLIELENVKELKMPVSYRNLLRTFTNLD
jgi:hypothetical protein